MKKALKINLSGLVFHIDEDAYEKLKKYLDAISSYFSDKEESKEIINDIEARIAELFQEKTSRESEVITADLVEEVIEIMGNPEDIADTAEDSGEKKKSSYSGRRASKRLYRDPEESVLGGVCGGLGAYFNVEPLIFRLLFVLLFFFGGASILVYIILWIVLPRAETAAQKLEMRGEPVNVSNIEKKIREEYETVKDNAKAAARSDSAKQVKEGAGEFFTVLGNILLVFVKVILIILGTALVLSGIVTIIGVITGAFVGLHFFPFGPYDTSLADILAPFSDPTSITLLIIGLSLLFLIPLIAMVYGLIRLIFNIKGQTRGLGAGAITLWFIALVMSVGIIAFESSNFSKSGSDRSDVALSIPSDTLTVSVNETMEEKVEDFAMIDIDDRWYFSENMEVIYGNIRLDIESSGTGDASLEIRKQAKGKNWDEADDNARRLSYSFEADNNRLVLDPYFFIEDPEKWRFPRVSLKLLIPEKTILVLDENTRDILDDIYNLNRVSEWNMAGKTWVMTDGGLKRTEE